MKTKFTHLNGIRKILIVFTLSIFLIVGGCYEISYIIQPDVVSPNSAFNVKICVQLTQGYEPTDYFPGYGILGILLPEGWTVKDSAEYLNNGLNNQDGFLCYDESVVSFLESNADQPPAGYYWWGAKSTDQIDIAHMDSGLVNLTILTNENTGRFITKFIVGDDVDYNKVSPEDPFGIVEESTLLPIKVDITQLAANSWKNEEWKVYPNPSNGKIFIQHEHFTDNVTLKIYDLNGILHKSEVLLKSLNCIDLSSVSKGTYIISLEKQGEIKTKKIIIQ